MEIELLTSVWCLCEQKATLRNVAYRIQLNDRQVWGWDKQIFVCCVLCLACQLMELCLQLGCTAALPVRCAASPPGLGSKTSLSRESRFQFKRECWTFALLNWDSASHKNIIPDWNSLFCLTSIPQRGQTIEPATENRGIHGLLKDTSAVELIYFVVTTPTNCWTSSQISCR